MSTERNCILLGANSDIAVGLIPNLTKDGWTITKWSRDHHFLLGELPNWDLVIICLGRVAPVGLWHEQDWVDWESTVESNLLLPVKLLRIIWPKHNPGANICFMAGSNPNNVLDGYSAYNCSKMGMLKFVEQIDHETPDAKFFALGPGLVLTKIHKPTLDSGWKNDRLKQGIEKGENRIAKIGEIYTTLKWCIDQPKKVVGGRNICVSDLEKYGSGLLINRLTYENSLFKLRRVE